MDLLDARLCVIVFPDEQTLVWIGGNPTLGISAKSGRRDGTGEDEDEA